MNLSFVVFSISLMIADCHGCEIPDVMQRWFEKSSHVTGVTADVEIIHYDFDGVRYGMGQLGYRGSKSAFIRVEDDVHPPVMPDDRKDHRALAGYHWRWRGEQLLNVDEKRKSAIVVRRKKNDDLTKGVRNLSAFEAFCERIDHAMYDRLQSPDFFMPFLPGCPSKNVLNCWRFEVTRETSDHTWIAARSTLDSPLVGEWQLYFQNELPELLAVQRSDEFNTRHVMIFKNARWNPPPWEEPSLAGFKVRYLGSSTDDSVK
jgi:hypothetical protein